MKSIVMYLTLYIWAIVFYSPVTMLPSYLHHFTLPTEEAQSPLLASDELSETMSDGVELKVRSVGRGEADIDPAKVFALMKESYRVLTINQGFSQWSAGKFNQIELRLVDGTDQGNQGNAFNRNGIEGPRFVMEKKDSGNLPVIMIPKNYRAFLARWENLNGRSGKVRDRWEKDLAGSIMHEMTHAILYGYHENLGSTDYGYRNGDWYTEGLARFYETEMDSLGGFYDEGFRNYSKNVLKLQRGGANYFLKYHDENFFTLRYENALFWLYFQKTFGKKKIVELTHALNIIPYEAEQVEYMALMKEVTGQRFEELLVDYHQWIYREEYRDDPRGAKLVSPVRVSYLRSLLGPLSLRIHHVDTRGFSPEAIQIKTARGSSRLHMGVYLETAKGRDYRSLVLRSDETVFIDDLPQDLYAINVVATNMGSDSAAYEILPGR